MAHLTWCSALDTQSDFMMYMQISPINILRYGTYVDVVAPLFSWPFLQHIVLPTLVEAQTGVQIPAPYLCGYNAVLKRVSLVLMSVKARAYLQ